MQYTINVRSRMLARQIVAKTRNSPNIIARQNLLIYSTFIEDAKNQKITWSCSARFFSVERFKVYFTGEKPGIRGLGMSL